MVQLAVLLAWALGLLLGVQGLGVLGRAGPAVARLDAAGVPPAYRLSFGIVALMAAVLLGLGVVVDVVLLTLGAVLALVWCAAQTVFAYLEGGSIRLVLLPTALATAVLAILIASLIGSVAG